MPTKKAQQLAKTLHALALLQEDAPVFPLSLIAMAIGTDAEAPAQKLERLEEEEESQLLFWEEEAEEYLAGLTGLKRLAIPELLEVLAFVWPKIQAVPSFEEA